MIKWGWVKRKGSNLEMPLSVLDEATECVVQVMRWQDTRALKPANEQLSNCSRPRLNYPRPKSITQVRTFSDNGVCSFTANLSNSGI